MSLLRANSAKSNYTSRPADKRQIDDLSKTYNDSSLTLWLWNLHILYIKDGYVKSVTYSCVQGAGPIVIINPAREWLLPWCSYYGWSYYS